MLSCFVVVPIGTIQLLDRKTAQQKSTASSGAQSRAKQYRSAWPRVFRVNFKTGKKKERKQRKEEGRKTSFTCFFINNLHLIFIKQLSHDYSTALTNISVSLTST